MYGEEEMKKNEDSKEQRKQSCVYLRIYRVNTNLYKRIRGFVELYDEPSARELERERRYEKKSSSWEEPVRWRPFVSQSIHFLRGATIVYARLILPSSKKTTKKIKIERGRRGFETLRYDVFIHTFKSRRSGRRREKEEKKPSRLRYAIRASVSAMQAARSSCHARKRFLLSINTTYIVWWWWLLLLIYR